MLGSSDGKNNHLDYSFSWRIFFWGGGAILYFPCLFQCNGNNFLLSVSLEASFSHSLVKCGAVVVFFFSFFFSCLLMRCWKPFDPQSSVLLTDWCFHTVTLAESPVFRGPRCHSGTAALEFSQIIPLCTCLCVARRWMEMESIYLYICLSVCRAHLSLIVIFMEGDAGTSDVSRRREI